MSELKNINGPVNIVGDVTIKNSAVAKLKAAPLGATYGGGFNVMTVTGTSSSPYTSTIGFSNYSSTDVLKLEGTNATFAGNVDVGGAGIASSRFTTRGSTNDSSAYALEAANSSGATMFYVRNDGLATFAGNVDFSNNKGLTWAGSHSVRVESNILKMAASSGIQLQNNTTVIGNLTIPEYIYHTSDSNTLIGFPGNDRVILHAGGNSNLELVSNSVAIRYNGGTKLETVAAGVEITGELQADTLDIDGNADISGNLVAGDTTADSHTFKGMATFVTSFDGEDDWADSAISIRERDLITTSSSDDKYSPNLNFHWGGAVSNSLWMGRNGHLNYGSYSSAGVPAADGVFNIGALTSTGKVTGTELEGTSLDINGAADISGALVATGGTKLSGGTLQVSTDSSVSTNYSYTFRDAVGINNPNSTSGASSSTTVMSIGAMSGGTVNTSLITTGAIGVGTASPSAMLDVNGEVQATSLDINGNADISGNVVVGGTVTSEKLVTDTAAIEEDNVSNAALMTLTGQGAGNQNNIGLRLVGTTASDGTIKIKLNAMNNAGTPALTGAGLISYYGGGDTMGIGQSTIHNNMAILIDNSENVTLNGTLTLSGAPSSNLHAATKAYVDGAVIANTDTQDLSISGTTLSLTNSPNVTIPQRSVSDSISSTSTTVAASSAAAKSAYDRGSTGVTNAASAQTTANAALPKAGGTMSGAIAMGDNNITDVNALTADQLNLKDGGDYITFYGGDEQHHSITSRDNSGTVSDDLRINSYGGLWINLDSNNNNGSEADFNIGRHGSNASTISNLFTLSGETGKATFTGEVEATSLDINGTADISGNANLPKRNLDWAGNISSYNISAANGDVIYHATNVTTVAGKIYYMAANGNLALADADAESTSKGFICVALGTSASTHGVLLRGLVTLQTNPVAGAGSPIYLSTTAGTAQPGAPTGTNDVVRIIGYQLTDGGEESNNNVCYFNPDNTYIKVS